MVAAEEVTTHIVRGGLFGATQLQVLEERPFFADTLEMREADAGVDQPAEPAAQAEGLEWEAESRLSYLDLCPASTRRSRLSHANLKLVATGMPAQAAAPPDAAKDLEPLPPSFGSGLFGGKPKAAAALRRSQSLINGSSVRVGAARQFGGPRS